MTCHSDSFLRNLVQELSKLPDETEWVEFKVNNKDPERIAKYISAVSNSATLHNRPYGYLVWGIDDDSHEIVGTSFHYRRARKGNEELEAWLDRMVNPSIGFSFYEVEVLSGIICTVLEVPCATAEPTKFGSTAYVRVGSNLKSLSAHKELEARLWRAFETTPAEARIAAESVTTDRVCELLDVSGYYRMMEQPIPANRDKVLTDFEHEKFVIGTDAGVWDITNLGALALANDLNLFDTLSRRAVRVIQYDGTTRTGYGKREWGFSGGYAITFDQMVRHIMAITPQQEIIVDGIRQQHTAFPEIAVRELLANCLIHQDLEQRGTNPMVEVFDNRIEFSNAGAPLVNVERLLDTVPVSRNEKLAGFMHKCGICEERGSGYDKVIDATCNNGLVAPIVQSQDGRFTKVALFSHIPFELTTKEDRIRTCYMQACLAYVNFEAIANADIRRTFGLGENKAQATRIIKDTMSAKLIKQLDPDAAPRNMRYIPFWA
jgi:predicted HTH transcriptional regulator